MLYYTILLRNSRRYYENCYSQLEAIMNIVNAMMLAVHAQLRQGTGRHSASKDLWCKWCTTAVLAAVSWVNWSMDDFLWLRQALSRNCNILRLGYKNLNLLPKLLSSNKLWSALTRLLFEQPFQYCILYLLIRFNSCLKVTLWMTFCLISVVLIVSVTVSLLLGIPHLIQADRYDRRLYA